MPRFKLSAHFTPLAVALVTASLLTAAPAVWAKDELTPLAVGAGFNPTDAAAKGFEIADNKALKGITRVAVSVFAVEYVVADNVSSQTSGFAAAGRATSTQYYKLLGVGETEFQALTNSFYARFLADLKDSGVEVVSAAQVLAAPTYAKLAATGVATPIKSDSTFMLSPPGFSVYGFARTGGGNSAKSKSIFGAIGDMGAGFSAVAGIMDTMNLAKELDAAVIEVRMRVSFAELSADNKGFFGRLSSTASTSAKVGPSIDNVMIGVQNGPLRSTVTMKHILTLDGSAFAEVREKATTTGDAVGAVALGLFKLAIGSKDSSSSKEMEVVAEPAKYQEVVGAGLGSAGSMVVARLKADR